MFWIHWLDIFELLSLFPRSHFNNNSNFWDLHYVLWLWQNLRLIPTNALNEYNFIIKYFPKEKFFKEIVAIKITKQLRIWKRIFISGVKWKPSHLQYDLKLLAKLWWNENYKEHHYRIRTFCWSFWNFIWTFRGYFAFLEETIFNNKLSGISSNIWSIFIDFWNSFLLIWSVSITGIWKSLCKQ